MSQKEVPCAAWIEEIPSSAISEDVSKPRPKSTPSGYIFHGLHERDELRYRGQAHYIPVDHAEETLEQAEQAAAAVELEARVLGFVRGDGALELADELV